MTTSLVDALPELPFTVADLDDLRLSAWSLRQLVAAGHVRALVRGVYVRSEVPDSLELRAAALMLVVSTEHIVVDRTAAWLHGVDTLLSREKELLPPIEVCALRGHHPTERRQVDSGQRDLAPHDLMRIGDVRVTTPLRTALDLGCRLRRREALATLNEFTRSQGVTRAMLTHELPRFRRRRGVIQLRELIGLIDPRIESQRESWVWLAIRDAGLPLPTPQVWVEDDDGRPLYRLDFAYQLCRVAVEYDGIEAHLKTPEQRQADEARRSWLRRRGWTVIVVRRGDFTGRRLDDWLDELSKALMPTYDNRRW
ncbi:MAG TPA: DUF559 domain-containing protein [Nocardioides sp.]|uniref:DUF559 domain-containing protein n=1 Tax=Nocardioides sp. TaxID=35761 RepID=UPI002ED860DD